MPQARTARQLPSGPAGESPPAVRRQQWITRQCSGPSRRVSFLSFRSRQGAGSATDRHYVIPLHQEVMRPLRYSINVTLDGCVDHRAGSTDEELHRFWAEKLARADALLFGRVTYEMMQAAWRWPANGLRPEWMAEWMEPFARTIDAAKKYVVSSTLRQVDWNAERVRGDLGTAVQQLKRESGRGLVLGGVKLPRA